MRFVACVVLAMFAVVTTHRVRAQADSPAPVPTETLLPLPASTISTDRAIVLVRGHERTTGAVIAELPNQTLILTSAHVIDHGLYAANQAKPSGDASRLRASEWLKVTDPVDGTVQPGTIVLGPDWIRDVVLIQTAPFAHRKKPVCLCNMIPSQAQIHLSTFTLETLQGDPRRPVLTYNDLNDIAGKVGGTYVPPAAEIELDAGVQQGYSGAPLYLDSTGFVIGMVRRFATISDPMGTGGTTFAQTTSYGVSVTAIRDYIKLHDALAAHTTISNDADRPLPDLITRAKRLQILRYDDPAGPGGSIAPEFNDIDKQMKKTLGDWFAGVDLFDPAPPRVLPPNQATSLTPDLCEAYRSSIGVIAVKRVKKGNTVSGGVALVDCRGNIIDRAAVDAVDLSQPTSAALYKRALSKALQALDGPRRRRLLNFALDGVPLSDGEGRGFYVIDIDKSGRRMIRAGWANSAAGIRSELQHPVELISVNGQSASRIDAAALDALLDSTGTEVTATVVDEQGVSRDIALRRFDRCALLAAWANLYASEQWRSDSRTDLRVNEL